MSHEIIDAYKKRWSTAWKRIDISTLFFELGFAICNKAGMACFISSNQFITTEYGRAIRKYLLDRKGIKCIIDFKDLRVFENAMTYVSIFELCNSASDTFGYYVVPKLPFTAPTNFEEINFNRIGDEPWKLGSNDTQDVIEKIENATKYRLKDYATPGCGLITGKDDLLMFNLGEEADIEKELILPIVRAQGCSRYGKAKPSKSVIYPYKYMDGKTVLIDLDELSIVYPKTYKYLMEHCESLKSRKDSRATFGERKGWYGLVRFGQLEFFNKPKICSPGEVKHNKFCIDYSKSGFSCARVFAITIDDPMTDIKYMLALLNSNVVEFYLHHIASLKAGGYYSYSASVLEKIPVVISEDQTLIIDLVFTLMEKKEHGLDCSTEESKINAMIYKLYNLTEREIEIIEMDLMDSE